METKCVFFNLESSEISWLALPSPFDYLCYGSTAVRNILILLVRGFISRTERTKLILCPHLLLDPVVQLINVGLFR